MLRTASRRLYQQTTQLAAAAHVLPSTQTGVVACAAATTLLATRGAKTTTGIVGVPVAEDARDQVKAQLQAVLDALEAHGIPAEAEYRKSVEKTVRFKLGIVQAETPDEQAEELLGRQLEEEIRMCQDELGLIPKMAEWKPWDVPEGYEVEYLEEHQVEGKMGGASATQAPQPK